MGGREVERESGKSGVEWEEERVEYCKPQFPSSQMRGLVIQADMSRSPLPLREEVRFDCLVQKHRKRDEETILTISGQ